LGRALSRPLGRALGCTAWECSSTAVPPGESRCWSLPPGRWRLTLTRRLRMVGIARPAAPSCVTTDSFGSFPGPFGLRPSRPPLTPVPAPLLDGTLAHPQVLGDVRRSATSLEPAAGLHPDPFPRSPLLSGQAPTIRVPHDTGIPQGSPDVTTRSQPKRVSSHRGWNPDRGAGQDATRSCGRPPLGSHR